MYRPYICCSRDDEYHIAQLDRSRRAGTHSSRTCHAAAIRSRGYGGTGVGLGKSANVIGGASWTFDVSPPQGLTSCDSIIFAVVDPFLIRIR
jgi:hypothetical protein